MGLFDKIKEKINEVHICAFCKRETSGLFSSIKLGDNQYICMDCFPKETKLMKEKDVCRDFSIHQLDYKGMKKYFAYRDNEQLRREKFLPDTTWLEGNLIVDNEHGYFKLREYDEIFVTQQIETVHVASVYENGKFTIICLLQMKNWIYKLLPLRCTMKTKSRLRKHQWKEYYDYIGEFRNSFCSNITFFEKDIKIVN